MVAIDGSYLNIPNSKELKEWYPMSENQPCPKGFCKTLASFQVDVLNGVVWIAELLPIQDEGDFLSEVHVSYRRRDAIYLYDRLYARYQVIAWHAHRGEHFVIHCPTESGFRVVREFMENSHEHDIITTISGPRHQKARIRELSLPEEVTVRLVKIALPNGTVEVLMTSVLDQEAHSREDLGMLYAARWGVETSLHSLKNQLEMERWSGRSLQVVLQDFYSAIFLFNLASALSARVNHELAREEVAVEPDAVRTRLRLAAKSSTRIQKKTFRLSGERGACAGGDHPARGKITVLRADGDFTVDSLVTRVISPITRRHGPRNGSTP